MARGEFFTTSGQCAVCHINMTDESGADVSLDSQWRSSMMANAARDPYWQAGVRNEVLVNPGSASFIQDKCTTCHMPMARFTEYVHQREARLLDAGGLADPANDLHVLAMDGISCTLCHQIEADNFGEDDSFSGHYEINADLPAGERHAYGPFPIAENNLIVMQSVSGFVPTESSHVQESEMCGVCHTLYTPTIDAAGEIAGEFAEQMVYPEWLASSYRDTDSCQACHTPAAQGGVVLSITGGEPRSPFMQHIFVGGNSYIPDLLRRHADELGLLASDAHVDATITAVNDPLTNRTAELTLDAVQVSGGRLQAEMTVTSLVGHKFPTSYPARRAWLHIVVTDGSGAAIFESGAFNPDGSIAGNDNDLDALLFEPHYEVIDSPEAVQIYEAIMGDTGGQPTTTLLSGAGYLKDNRLLPAGFDKAGATDNIAAYGAAVDDANFTGGADTLVLDIDLGEAPGPYTVTVELLYQSIAYRWAQNLARHDAFETERFLGYYNENPSPAGLVTSVTAAVE